MYQNVLLSGHTCSTHQVCSYWPKVSLQPNVLWKEIKMPFPFVSNKVANSKVTSKMHTGYSTQYQNYKPLICVSVKS